MRNSRRVDERESHGRRTRHFIEGANIDALTIPKLLPLILLIRVD